MASLLVASSPNGVAEIESLLSPHHQLICANSVARGLQLVREKRPDAILCAVVFDDSRMFDFLKIVKSDKELCETPFICCRLQPSQLPKAMVDGLETASRALGACMYLDVVVLKETGREADVLHYIEDCLPRNL